MNTCAFLLLLAAQISADGIEGPTGKTSGFIQGAEVKLRVWTHVGFCLDWRRKTRQGVVLCAPFLKPLGTFADTFI